MDGAKFGDGSGVIKTHLKETAYSYGEKALKTLTKQMNDSALLLFLMASEFFICFDKWLISRASNLLEICGKGKLKDRKWIGRWISRDFADPRHQQQNTERQLIFDVEF